MTGLNYSAKSSNNDGGGDFKDIVNVLLKINDNIANASNILKQSNDATINVCTTEMTTIPSAIADIMREAAQFAESKKMSEFCRTINDALTNISFTFDVMKRIQSDIATQPIELAQPQEQQHTQFDYLDQAVSLLYTINLKLQRVLLAGNACYVHSLAYVGDGISETEDLKEALTRLLALVSRFTNSNSTVELL